MTIVDKLMLYVGSHFGTDDATVLTMHKPKKAKLFIVPLRETRGEMRVNVKTLLFLYQV